MLPQPSFFISLDQKYGQLNLAKKVATFCQVVNVQVINSLNIYLILIIKFIFIQVIIVPFTSEDAIFHWRFETRCKCRIIPLMHIPGII